MSDSQTPETPTRVTYRAGRLLTGGLGEEITDGAVVVEGGAIVYAGPAADAPEGGEVRDYGADATLMPGMIDTHVHLAFDGSAHPVEVMLAADEIERYSIMLQSARQLLSAGVTTARDLGAPDLLDVRVKQAVNEGLARGPRLLVSNAPLTVTGGHCYFLGGEAETVDGLRKKVREARRDGADHIKIMSTGGNMTPGTLPYEAQYTVEELKAIVDTAHHYGMKVAAHCHGTPGIARAIEAGVDSLEHFSFTQEGGRLKVDDEPVKKAAEGGHYVCKTMCAALGTFLSYFGLADDEEFMPSDLMRTQWDAGLKIVAGTDGGIDNAPHHEYVYGLEGMAAYGLTNDEVLYSATALAAESLGLADVTGRLAEGLAADLLVVAGNPRQDLRTLRDIEVVVARGEEYLPEFRSTRTWNDEIPKPQYQPAG